MSQRTKANWRLGHRLSVRRAVGQLLWQQARETLRRLPVEDVQLTAICAAWVVDLVHRREAA